MILDEQWTTEQVCDEVADSLENTLTDKHIGFVLIMVETEDESKDGEHWRVKSCTLRTNMGAPGAIKIMKGAIERAPQ